MTNHLISIPVRFCAGSCLKVAPDEGTDVEYRCTKARLPEGCVQDEAEGRERCYCNSNLCNSAARGSLSGLLIGMVGYCLVANL